MLYRSTFNALATTVTVALTEKSASDQATQLIQSMCNAVDQVANHHNPSAEIHAFDRAEGGKITVSSLLRSVLERAILNAELTSGILNPCFLAGDYKSEGPWKEIEITSDEVSIPQGYRINLLSVARAGLADDLAHAILSTLALPCMVTVGTVTAVAANKPSEDWKVNTAALSHMYEVVQIPNNHALAVAPASKNTSDEAPWQNVVVQANSALYADAIARAAQMDPKWALRNISSTNVTAKLVDRKGREHLFGHWASSRRNSVNKLLDATDQFDAITGNQKVITGVHRIINTGNNKQIS